jgi:hypothetical protein
MSSRLIQSPQSETRPTNSHLRSFQQLDHHEYGRGRENSEHRANEQRFGRLLHTTGSLTQTRSFGDICLMSSLPPDPADGESAIVARLLGQSLS